MYLSRNLLSGPVICCELDDRGSIPKSAECLSSPHFIPAPVLHTLVLNGYRTEAGSWPLTAVHICSPSGPEAPTYIGCSYVTGIICNTTLVNSAFHTRQNCSENYPQFGHALSKERQPFPRPKIISVLMGSKLLTWLGASMSRSVSARLPRNTLFWISKSRMLIIFGLSLYTKLHLDQQWAMPFYSHTHVTNTPCCHTQQYCSARMNY